jgi:uncharacterized membrane protein YheB (UPF0754 family)
MPTLTTWIAVPALGALIGYVTNWLAVKMIFRPIRPVSVLGLRVQGLIGRRQRELAESIGRVVGDHLVGHQDVVKSLAGVDFDQLLGDVVDTAIEPRIKDMQRLPFVGGLFTDERIGGLRRALKAGVVAQREAILEKLESAVENKLDVQGLVTDKIAAFPVEKVESLVLAVASRELRAIELLGAVLGALIGVLQVLVIWALS